MKNIPREHPIVPFDSKRPLHVVLVTLVVLLDIVMTIIFIWLICHDLRNWFCYLPWLLFFLIFPLLFWCRKVREITTDKATLEKLYDDNELGKFKKYHILESEFNSLDFKKYLKKCCLRPFEEEAVCPGEKDKDQGKARRRCEIVAERLNPEREKRAKEIIRQFKTNSIETRTALLADQIRVPQYDVHNKK
jgi:hypothetical protein